jgi:hypothetical protein
LDVERVLDSLWIVDVSRAIHPLPRPAELEAHEQWAHYVLIVEKRQAVRIAS